MLKMIRYRGKDNRVWSLIKRIREVRRLYWNIIKKSNAMNQTIIAETKPDKIKRKATNLALNIAAAANNSSGD
jgi:hypothetical protein